jgi:AraC-like DNA-binding protein
MGGTATTVAGTFLNHAGVTLFLLVAALAWRDARQSLAGRLLTALALSLAALQLTWLMGPLQLGKPVFGLLRFVGVFNVGLIWLACLSLLRDDFRIDRWHWAGLATLSLAPFCYLLDAFGWRVPLWAEVNSFGGIAPFVMVVHVIWVALSERRSDLVEARRRGRVWIVLLVMLASIVSLLSEYIEDVAVGALIRDAISILPAALVLFFWLTRLDAGKLMFETQRAQGDVNPRDAALHRKLIAAMEEDRVFLQPGISIESLAERLGTPSHQLRHLINSALGHRNFAAFLNGYRLDYAKAALGNDERARETVLAIAYEAGFSSLQTFNRVFRDAEGVTPTAYRAQALAETSQN